MRGRELRSFIVAAACLGLGAAALWSLARFWPGAAGERALASFLRARALPDDLVIVTPALSLDRLHPYARAGLNAISADGDRVMMKSGFSRAWLVGALGVTTPTDAPPPAPRLLPGSSLTETHVVGNTALFLITRKEEAAHSLADVRALLLGARATVRAAAPGSAERPCTREGERLRCGKEGWQWLGPETITVKGERRACIWAHPVAGEVLALELPSLAGAGRVRVATLLSDAATARSHGAPVDVTIKKGEQTLARYAHNARDPSHERDLVLSGAPAAPLRIEWTTLQDGLAHFCIDVRRRP